MDSTLTLKDAQKYRDLLAKQFTEITKSDEQSWETFTRQKDFGVIATEYVPIIKGILQGNATISIKDYRDALVGAIKQNKYCLVIPVLHSMTDGNLLPELSEHYLKITSIILTEEAIQNAYIVRYKDIDNNLREFCTYAKNSLDARLQALECIECVADNPRSILDIVREKEHADSFDW